jgi:hypothetical protein
MSLAFPATCLATAALVLPRHPPTQEAGQICRSATNSTNDRTLARKCWVQVGMQLEGQIEGDGS